MLHPLLYKLTNALSKFPRILKQILFNRGMGTDAEARAFLKAEPNADTDPFQLIGMQAVTERVCYAVQNNEPIAIYGDYDVDGVTATALAGAGTRSARCKCARLYPEPI